MEDTLGLERTDCMDENPTNPTGTEQQTKPTARRSVVQVYFERRNMTLAYYNDRFDLHCGDLVYVEGKLEGLLGQVVEVSYNFKIRLSDYKRIISVADTTVNGQFFMAGRQFITFDREALPNSKVVTWFRGPLLDDDEFVSSCDDTAFDLANLKGMNVSANIVERGHDYFIDDNVQYISLDGTKGYAIVRGCEAYEVEFNYQDGKISGLICSCSCCYNCKHEYAAMEQLQETLKFIETHYKEEYERSGYFAAVKKNTLFAFAIGDKENGSLTL